MRWQKACSSYGCSDSPCVYNDKILFLSEKSKLSCCDLSGNIIWERKVTYYVYSPIIVDKEGNTFVYKYAEIDGKQYRVAGSIIGGVKAILQKMPNLKEVSVIKQGQGMNTRYQVIPYTQPNQGWMGNVCVGILVAPHYL